MNTYNLTATVFYGPADSPTTMTKKVNRIVMANSLAEAKQSLTDLMVSGAFANCANGSLEIVRA